MKSHWTLVWGLSGMLHIQLVSVLFFFLGAQCIQAEEDPLLLICVCNNEGSIHWTDQFIYAFLWNHLFEEWVLEKAKNELDHSVQFLRSAYCRLASASCSEAKGSWERSQWFGVKWRVQDSWEEGQDTAPSSPSCSCPFFFLGTALCQPIVCMETWLLFLWLSTLPWACS